MAGEDRRRPRSATRKRAALGLAALAAATVALGAAGGPGAGPAAAAAERPNVVVVMSDDQTLASQGVMAETNSLVGERGATFANTFTNWPLCCPSRATFLTGQYSQNHGVLGNSPPSGGFDRLDSSNTLAVWLQDAGYYTAHIGKYLNGYEGSAVGVPAGWSEWHGSKRTYMYYGYELLEDGQIVPYGDREEDPDDPAEPGMYSTDVYTDKAVELIGERAPSDQPFFLSVAYLAPHGGGPDAEPGDPDTRCEDSAKPAIRHKGAFEHEPLPIPPSFNEADVSDKPTSVFSDPLMTAEEIADVTRNYRCRMESLLAVDEGVGRIVEALRAAGEMQDTVFVYTSDNGYFHGEHRINQGKNRPYEEATHVPLLIRGPGIAPGTTVAELASNADVAPTILAATGAEAARTVDGRSLIPFTRHPERRRGRELLIAQSSYSAVRTSRYIYVNYNGGPNTGQFELYDLDADPYQLENLASDPAYDAVQEALADRLADLRDCAGKDCRLKPQLRLKLEPDPRRSGGKRCRQLPLVAELRGKALDLVVEVKWRLDRKLTDRDRRAPFREQLRGRQLDGKPDEVRAIVELLDGRRLTLQKPPKACA